MTYLWLKALHIAAVIVWMGGMLASSVQLAALRTGTPPLSDTRLKAVDLARRWDVRVTVPAMLLAWTLGLALAVTGGWFRSGWLVLKLALVVLLSAMHGVLTGTLRRIGSNPHARVPAIANHVGFVIMSAVLLIALLVVLKPF